MTVSEAPYVSLYLDAKKSIMTSVSIICGVTLPNVSPD